MNNQDPTINVIAAAIDASYEEAEEYVTTSLRAALLDSPAVQNLEEVTYKIPRDYLTWTELKAVMLHDFLSAPVIARIGKQNLNEDHYKRFCELLIPSAASASIARTAGRFDFPFWVVSREVAERLQDKAGVWNNDLEGDAKMPFPALYFLMPDGVGLLPKGESLRMVGCAHYESLDALQSLGFALPSDPIGQSFYVAAITNKGRCYYSRLPVEKGMVVFDESSEAETADEAVLWAIRLLNIMNKEPHLNESAVLEKTRKAKKDRKGMKFYIPRRLGPESKIIRLS